MEIKVVLGFNFGDEGKGMVVQNLCKQALAENKRVLVVRFSGGPQAAHTVVHNGVSHICSTYGSGCLLGVPTLWLGVYTAIDPISFLEERETLRKKGVDPEIWFSDGCKVITPYDVLHNQSDEKSLSDGTCGKGVWAAMSRRCDFKVRDLHDADHRSLYLSFVKDWYSKIPQNRGLEFRFKKASDEVSALSTNFSGNIISQYDVVIYEGSQGLLLDPTHSPFQPHVTATNLFNFPTVNEDVEIYMVTRTYLTRHGNGYEPKKCENFYDLSKKYESNIFNEFQGEFKTGVISLDLMNRIIDRARLDNLNAKFNLVVTHMDIPFEQNKFMYELGNQIHTFEEENKEVNPDNICQTISDNLYLNFENIYYTNSPNSSLHVSHMSGCSR